MTPFASIGKSFPAEPTPSTLRITYNELRAAAITVNRSRAQFVRQVKERDLQITSLEGELMSYANDAALDYQEKAQLLSILGKYRDVFSTMEQAGDDLLEGLNDYDYGARPFQGGGPFTRLIAAVRAFAKAWKAAKEMSPQIKQLEAGV